MDADETALTCSVVPVPTVGIKGHTSNSSTRESVFEARASLLSRDGKRVSVYLDTVSEPIREEKPAFAEAKKLRSVPMKVDG